MIGIKKMGVADTSNDIPFGSFYFKPAFVGRITLENRLITKWIHLNIQKRTLNNKKQELFTQI